MLMLDCIMFQNWAMGESSQYATWSATLSPPLSNFFMAFGTTGTYSATTKTPLLQTANDIWPYSGMLCMAKMTIGDYS